jgi:RimJ/RimL family protein N-acetyltransferase
VTGPPETVELAGGWLTRVMEADAGQVAAGVRASLDHLRPFMPWATDAAADPAAQLARVRAGRQRWEEGSEYEYVLRARPDGPVIGVFGLHRRVGPDALEIGYWIHAGYVQRGYATAGAAALTQIALAMPGVRQVEIHTDEANTASAAVARRLGYRLDRVEPRPPLAPAETGRHQVWVCTRPEATAAEPLPSRRPL